MARAWYDKWLKGIDNGIEKYGPVTSERYGAGWSSATDFPRPGMTYRRAYLSPQSSGTAPGSGYDGSLTAAAAEEEKRLTVAPGLNSLCSNESYQSITQLNPLAWVTGCDLDERFREQQGLTFTTEPVTKQTQVSGPIAVHLNTVHDAPDGYWTVAVTDVAPDGRSTQISTGQLVSSSRVTDRSVSEFSPNGDYTFPSPAFTADTIAPVVPGEPTILDIGATATDAVLEPGHRLRVSVFASNFAYGLPPMPTLAASELKPQHLQLDPQRPSWVNLPSDLALTR